MEPHFGQPISTHHKPLGDAKLAMIMIHGRGASPKDILSLGDEVTLKNISLLAPAAANRTWYPYSFLAPIAQNEPGISSGIFTISKLTDKIIAKGIKKENIFFLGFSQGACLACEFLARNPDRYGGLFAFSGGLIGPKDTPRHYIGSLDKMPVFLGCSDVDAHVPKWRVDESAEVFQQLGASVTKRIYPGMPHIIYEDEVQFLEQSLNEKYSHVN